MNTVFVVTVDDVITLVVAGIFFLAASAMGMYVFVSNWRKKRK